MAKERDIVQRRGTVVEEAAEGLIEEKELERLEKLKKQKSLKERLRDAGKSIYNHEYREFLGRDGKACCQLSFCYFIFYAFLTGFFLIMLLAFHATIDPKVPTYYDKSSVMNHVKVNPALGFRPQYDPENNLITVNKSDENQWKDKNVRQLDYFFERYENFKDRDINIIPSNPDRMVNFNYQDIMKNTSCSKENDYGYRLGTPCVLLKINRIFGWKPLAFEKPPNALNITMNKEMLDLVKANQNFLYISCEGENVFDKDNVGKIDFYSMYPSREIGGIPTRYFPYLNQPYYMSPFVFAHFRNVSKNTLVNVRCRLWAENVDNSDNLNQRGMARFELYITE